MRKGLTAIIFLCALWLPAARALDRTQIGVIVNTRDPQSVEIGDYYAAQRRIPFQNIIRVSFTPIANSMTRERFNLIKAQVDEQVLPHIQAYAITWTEPYRVDCMSVTAAFAFGFDPAYCADGCKPTRPSAYFNSPSRLPFTQQRIRPTMMIAAASVDEAKALIDRGVASDGTLPAGTIYLLSTTDGARNVRNITYPAIDRMIHGNRVRVRSLMQDELRGETLIEAYWKSVAMPGQGIFIGEPLAAPFRKAEAR